MANSAYNTSSAYDFTAFEQRQRQPEKRALSKSELRVHKTPKQFLASVISLRALSTFAIAVAVVSLIVYNHASLNEVTGQIAALSSELTVLESNHTRMQSQIGDSMSPRVVAQIAENELGLRKLGKYQTEYVYIYHEDRICRIDEVQDYSLRAKIQGFFGSAASTIKEYIAGQ